jgi:diguanylate cyclase (GGDEF)-like protein/PAS domain S-box-containing protein
MVRSLRFWISLGLSSVVGLALLIIVGVLFGVLQPRLNDEVEAKNRALGQTVATQVNAFLTDASDQVTRLSRDILATGSHSPMQVQVMLDTLTQSDVHFEAIYLLDVQYQVSAVGLPQDQRHIRVVLVGSDFSARNFLKTAHKTQQVTWSDTYLSQRGGIVVALAAPLSVNDSSAGTSQPLLVAELNLAELSRIVRDIGTPVSALPIIVDGHKQIVGHPNVTHSLRQESVGQLPFWKKLSENKVNTSVFQYEKTEYIGSVTPIPVMGWSVLVAQPTNLAFGTVTSTMKAVAAAMMLAMIAAWISALWVSRYATQQVAKFSTHVQAIAAGNYHATIPRSGTEEIESLARSMHQMANAVLEREDRLRLAASVFDSSAEGIMITDAQKNIISINPAFTAITGYKPEEVLNKSPSLLASGLQDRNFYGQAWAEVKRNGFWRGEIWNRRKDGVIYPELLSISEVRGVNHEITHYIGSFFDISEKKQAERRIQFLAHHDALTQLPNRVLLDDRLSQAIAQSHRSQNITAVLFLDLDRFKLINDTLGHNVGDALLVRIAELLKGVLRETETVARLGGDEFVIIIPELPETERAAVVAQKVIEALRLPQIIDGRLLHFTASVGISLYPVDAQDVATLLSHADTAMYAAKDHGGNNFQFFAPDMNQAIQERVAIENDLHLALERGEFMLYYQPQVDCLNGEVTGMEALIRWQHPTRGLVPPLNFISIAEETGLIVPIGEWVLREACQQACRWREAGHTQLCISVNLSARQFQQPDLHDRIESIIRETGINPATLELELTESMLMIDPDGATDLLRKLAALGVKLAIDDFGTGYSSLAYLKRFPVTRLKIDQSFVRDIATDPSDAAIVSAVVAMASSLKLDVIAEGGETLEQLRHLTERGCHHIQGYYFGRPKPAVDIRVFRYPPLSLDCVNANNNQDDCLNAIMA